MRTRERAALTGAENLIESLLHAARVDAAGANMPSDPLDAGTRAEARRWVGRLNARLAEIKRALDPERSERNKRAAETRRRKREAKGGASSPYTFKTDDPPAWAANGLLAVFGEKRRAKSGRAKA